MISNFTILGERCSGTNYLEELMKTNFQINITWDYGHKHFFGFYDFKQDENEDKTLFIGIIRDPISWIDSFFKEKHHIPNKSVSIEKFLFDEFYSIDETTNNIIEKDLNYINGKKYKNIFELRFLKNFYLINIIPNKVKNYILINYENLKNKTETVLDIIKNKFNLQPKYTIYKNITYYRKETNIKFTEKKINLNIIYKLLILKNINKLQEAKLGYNYLMKSN